MIIKKYVFQDGEILYLIFDDKNIHINRRVLWKPIDDLYVYDLIYIRFYPNSSAKGHSIAALCAARYEALSHDARLDYLNNTSY